MDVANGLNLRLGGGAVYFNPDSAAGVPTGELFLGNCTALEASTSATEVSAFSSVDKAGAQIASDYIKPVMTLKVTGNEFVKANIARALFGENALLTQTGASITAEDIEGVLQGRWYKLLYRTISAVAVTGPAGTPEYDVTDDYLVDAVSGRIYIVPGGAIADDSDLEVDYTYATISLNVSRGITQVGAKGSLRFKGDPVRGTPDELEIWRVTLRPDGAIQFITESDYSSWTLVGNVEADSVNHPDEPHYRHIQIPAS